MEEKIIQLEAKVSILLECVDDLQMRIEALESKTLDERIKEHGGRPCFRCSRYEGHAKGCPIGKHTLCSASGGRRRRGKS